MVGTLSDILSVSLQVALIATLVVMVPGALTGYVLSRFRFPGKRLLSALVLMPLVLPPTAVGFLLLELFADNGPLGRKSLGVDLDLLLTWKGAVVASAFMALPLVVRTARVTFDGLDPRHERVAQTLGYSRAHALWRFVLPAARRGLVAAALLAFARS
ncbi:MAG TPA: ABC transporter permease subunit, partial [Polyangiaceae bacterium]|nr:ABC transporter permease subunit [Polyangiaceae bacterium]